MKERDINFLILSYLKKKGLDDTAKVFQHQCGLNDKKDDVVSLDHQLDADNALDDLLFSYAAENDPQRFVDSFDQLVVWVDSSLDLYKAELQRVLYPVFVHIYLQLVQYGASNTAAELLKRYRRRLVEVGGRASSIRSQEITELQSVAVAQHLEVNPFAKAARAQRSTLGLCTYSFELLMHQLQGSKQWLILNIINQHIRFELHEGLLYLDTAVADEEGAGLLQGQAGHEAGAINSTPLDVGLLRDGIEDQFADKKLQDLQEEEKKVAQAAAVGDDGVNESFGLDDGPAALTVAQQARQAALKRSKAVKERAVAAAKQKQKDVLDTRRMPMIPLLSFHEKHKSRLSTDLEHRTAVNPSNHLPSCCFFTILNSRQTLTALTTSPDAKQVAAGFSDSMIRVYNLAGLAKQRGFLSKRVREQGLAPPVASKRRRGVDEMDVDLEDEELQEELEDLSQRQTFTLTGHSNTVNSICYSADQQMMFSASSDATVRLWSTELRKGLAAYRGHVYPVWDVAACPHGTYLVSGGSDRTARLWSTESAQPLRIFAGHQSDVDVVAWHPNSHYIATGSSDRTVRLWDIAMGSCCRLMGAQTSCLTSLAFSPDGRQLAAGTEDGGIAVYDLGSARRMALLEGHDGPVWSVSYSQGSGSVLATGGADRTVRLYSMPKGDNVLDAINEELAAAAAAEAVDVGAAAVTGRSAGRLGALQGATGGAAGLGHAAHHTAAHWVPYTLVQTLTTRATPVVHVGFTSRNLLLAGGPWNLQPIAKPRTKGTK